jgi:hypothetical protein
MVCPDGSLSPCGRRALELLKHLDDYPILDENLLGEYELEDFDLSLSEAVKATPRGSAYKPSDEVMEQVREALESDGICREFELKWERVEELLDEFDPQEEDDDDEAEEVSSA